jgi:thiosulfate/3-mercaptopyruvate sulfurtransferase
MGALIDVAGLALALAGDEPPLVLDVRWRLGGPPGIGSYREGHIPGAVFVDLGHDLSSPPGAGGRHPMPDASSFEQVMRARGVSGDRPVVAYDDGDSMPAARAWWLLRYFGHPSVRVLDGGYRAWTAANQPVSDVEPAVITGSFIARAGGMPLIDAAGAAGLARDGVLIDVRAAARYRGEHEPVDPVAGHIPGAVNVPIAATANPDGTFRPAVSLAETFAAQGAGVPVTVGVPAPVGAYCGSGVTAARGVLALELAGIPAAIYIGSWSDWITDPTRPIAK